MVSKLLQSSVKNRIEPSIEGQGINFTFLNWRFLTDWRPSQMCNKAWAHLFLTFKGMGSTSMLGSSSPGSRRSLDMDGTLIFDHFQWKLNKNFLRHVQGKQFIFAMPLYKT